MKKRYDLETKTSRQWAESNHWQNDPKERIAVTVDESMPTPSQFNCGIDEGFIEIMNDAMNSQNSTAAGLKGEILDFSVK